MNLSHENLPCPTSVSRLELSIKLSNVQPGHVVVTRIPEKGYVPAVDIWSLGWGHPRLGCYADAGGHSCWPVLATARKEPLERLIERNPRHVRAIVEVLAVDALVEDVGGVRGIGPVVRLAAGA